MCETRTPEGMIEHGLCLIRCSARDGDVSQGYSIARSAIDAARADERAMLQVELDAKDAEIAKLLQRLVDYGDLFARLEQKQRDRRAANRAVTDANDRGGYFGG